VEGLLDFATTRGAGLVVTGTRGRDALTSTLLGSVSAGLAGAAEGPVGLVPATATAG
jgi:nucleotide-binding universal stress UspA family protein